MAFLRKPEFVGASHAGPAHPAQRGGRGPRNGERLPGVASRRPQEVRRLKGKRLRLTYQIGAALSADCDGDMDCGRHDRAPIVEKVRVVGGAPKK